MALDTVSVGIDHADLAHDALRWATALAASTPATTVRAIGAWQLPLSASMPRQAPAQSTAAAIKGQVRDRVAHAVDSVAAEVPVEQVVIEGPTSEVLVAESHATDLLVVGRTGRGKRHGLSRFAELVLGSTARHCVHHSASAVAAVPEGAVWRNPATVVVGLDGSTSSFRAFEWAITMLPSTTVVHVVHAFAPWVGDGLTPRDLDHQSPEFVAREHQVNAWVDTVLDRQQSVLDTAPVVEVVIGSARDGLTDTGYPVDAIVVGERGRTGVAARVLGSIADHVVRYSTCPVIVVPEDR